jgi:hypothetical protein
MPDAVHDDHRLVRLIEVGRSLLSELDLDIVDEETHRAIGDPARGRGILGLPRLGPRRRHPDPMPWHLAQLARRVAS